MKRTRFESPMLWHVFARGARRLGLFWDEQDYSVFLDLLRRGLDSSGTELHGYTLMTNHFHLILEATSLTLTACMRRVDYGYSRFHNKKHGLSGHTFDGPYQAYVQPTPRLALSKLAYVFLNPVRANRSSSALSYRWSNAGDFLGRPGSSPISVDPRPLLSKVSSSLGEGMTIFKRAFDLEASRSDRRSHDVLTAQDVQRLHYEWLLDLARERESLLFGERPEEVALLWARRCGVSPAAMAPLDGTRAAQSISKTLWKLKHRLSTAGTLDALLALAS